MRADPTTLRSSWRIIVSSVLRRSYPEAPVSDPLLFGRKQDFAYQKEVEGNPAQRHHIRFWRVPEGWVMPGGRRVDWLAGATYERPVGLSTLTLRVTHKIDADIDVERDYVVDDVRWANADALLEIWPDFFTAYHHRNGGGGLVRAPPRQDRSDGGAESEHRLGHDRDLCRRGQAGRMGADRRCGVGSAGPAGDDGQAGPPLGEGAQGRAIAGAGQGRAVITLFDVGALG
ncbi:LssY C-terminus [Actinomyces ruminicola]|uniref:LssY C-terminus n=1 Tax=Actinomyces ruminicola TaxID=332524 RepID=A0A1H0EDY7_9ACTO|nr:LssY C-terminus [Actinomyces ruminicola]